MKVISNPQLFLIAEMNKQVALYSLPSGNKTTLAVGNRPHHIEISGKDY
jgi:hypothetical protein